MATELTSTVESYLEAIFELDEVGDRVTQARLARWFNVSPPATAEVVKRMQRQSLVKIGANHVISLTASGRGHAEHMARKHRLIERFIVDVLGVPWHLADEEARKMEPGVSDVVAERMHAALSGANRCPHGNPIPGEDVPRTEELGPLDGATAGASLTIDRIREDLELDLGMLKYLEEHDLLPGRVLTVIERDPEGGVTVDRDGAVVAVGPVLASHLLCVPA